MGTRELETSRTEQKQQLAKSNNLPFGTEGNSCWERASSYPRGVRIAGVETDPARLNTSKAFPQDWDTDQGGD